MSFLTGNEEFVRCKKLTEPVYQTPRSVQEALDIASAHKEGIFEIEKTVKKAINRENLTGFMNSQM